MKGNEGALARLAEVLGQAGRWSEAERVIDSISDEGWQAEALTELAEALGQAGRWPEADTNLRSNEQFSKMESRSQIRTSHVRVVSLNAGWYERVWLEAERVIGSISNEGEREGALHNLADALAKHNEHEHLLSLVHHWWLQAGTRDEAIKLLPLAFGLIPLHPNIGMVFYEAFAWVDNFLRG